MDSISCPHDPIVTELDFFAVWAIKHREGDDLADAKSSMISRVVFAFGFYHLRNFYIALLALKKLLASEDLEDGFVSILVDTPNFDGWWNGV